MNQARYHLAGEPISKNAFRRFESVYKPEMPEMHLQNFEKLQSRKKAEKSLEISVFLLFSCLHLNQTLVMAGIAGFEPANAGVKVLCLDRLGYIPIKKAKQPVFDARSFAYPQAAVRAVFPRYYISIFISCQVKRKPAEAFVLKKSLMPRRRTARKSGSGGV